MNSQVVVVLPTKNEEQSIHDVLLAVRAEVTRLKLELMAVVVVDDSSDGTAEKARAAGAEVISGGGEGLGTAMLRGLKKAAELSPEIIISMDSDGQVDLSELENFIQPVVEGRADLVVGSRFLGGDLVDYEYPAINRHGVRVLAWYMRLLTGLSITDSHGGIRAMRTAVAEKLFLFGRHTYVQEAIIDAHRNSFRVLEIPSVWRVREHGESRVVRSIPTYIYRTLPALLKRALRW